MTHHRTRFTARNPTTTTRKTRMEECAARKSLPRGAEGISSPDDRGELSPTGAASASGRTITESRRPSKGGGGARPARPPPPPLPLRFFVAGGTPAGGAGGGGGRRAAPPRPPRGP